MPSLKEIRNRIASVSSTIQITSAMKMVSASKLKKAQDAIAHLRPYAQCMEGLLQDVIQATEGSVNNVFATTHKNAEEILYVVFTANRGLCGMFNASVIKQVQLLYNQNENTTISFITVGKKAFDALNKQMLNIKENKSDLVDFPTFEATATLANELMEHYKKGLYEKVTLVYNHFKNAATQTVITEDFLPIRLPKVNEGQASDYIFEIDEQVIVDQLVPQSLRVQLFKALLDTRTAEHAARMTAMHKATDNAEELRSDLVLQYNKARQATITKEILEILGGAEALKN